MPFDSCGNWFERAGNKTHMLTRERVIRRDLLFKPGDKFDPAAGRAQQAAAAFAPLHLRYRGDRCVPDSLDSTRVNMVITHARQLDDQRRRWHDTARGAPWSGFRTPTFSASGNTLKFKTNFSRRDFSYGGNIVEYKIPNVLGTFYTADFVGRPRLLQLGH